MQDELTKLCPDCKLSVKEINPADAGTKLPSQIVTELQREPDVNYIVPAWSDGAIGVPQALKSAGLTDKVKMVTQVPGR